MQLKKKPVIFTEEPIQYMYAGFMQRLSAAIIDWALILLASQFIRLLFDDHGISGIVLSWLYFSIQESGKRKSTLGKRVMNMYICGYDGKRISFGRATVRYFSKYLSVIIVFIGFLMVLWDDKAQALHDKLSGTLVITTEMP